MINRKNAVHFHEEVLKLPQLGLGLGLRHVHYDHILKAWPKVDWFEVISENYIYSNGRPRYILNQIAERYPIVMHGVSLSIGSTDPLDMNYLNAIQKLAKEIHPKWISDHLCWTGILGVNSHDLLPLPLTEEALKHTIKRINIVQDFLQRPLVLENPSTYLSFTHSLIPEAEFLSQLVKETGCGLLLDVNNTYVSCFNAGKDPLKFFDDLPMESVVQMHLAGHQNCGTHIIDTHDRPVIDEVWDLFRIAWAKTRDASILLEWDGNIPTFEVCHQELLKAKNYMNGYLPVNRVGNGDDNLVEGAATPINFMVPNVMENIVE